MADVIVLTSQPVRITAATTQPLDQALDVSAYDELDLMLGLVGLEGSGPAFAARLLTSMQKESEDGWEEVGTFTAIDAVNKFKLANFKGFLRYLRWDVTALGGSATACTFTINGLARRWTSR